MHNRWNLEFDTDYLPGFSEFMSRPFTRLAKGGVWSERTCLKDTWEIVMLLYVPILYDDKVRGICGVELSELYFHFSYPSIDSDYGSRRYIGFHQTLGYPSVSGLELAAVTLIPDLETFFSDFISRVETLTSMERTVLQYYIEGCEISEVAKRAVISINTAKKHNTNINRKLCIS
ncbi:MAG: LuxR C-terminal-related transcriptional regulator [Acetatifactor sp.]